MNLIETLRGPKIGPFAIFDVAAALGAAYFLAPRIGVSRGFALTVAVPAGVVIHELLGVDTPLNRMVFGREPMPQPNPGLG